ncbi:peptidase C26 [Bacteroidales bacterium 6E]|nr:peptidase C26 [Bacteroidales bacterium 6E]
MKRIFIWIVMIISTLEGLSTSSSTSGTRTGVKHLLIANPTVRNLETLHFLIEHQIFRLNTRNIHIIGIYHQKQAYDFSASQKFLLENNISYIDLQEVEGTLDLSNIFEENECTPVFRDLFDKSVGILFFGGPDIQPEIYGEENLYSEVTDPNRHLFEVSLAFHFAGSTHNLDFKSFMEDRQDYLMTGFCLGLQTMNVAGGGSLWQDIPAQVYGKSGPNEIVKTERENLHRNYWQEINPSDQYMTINLHPVHFTDHPFFGKTIPVRKTDTPRIYSSHHQSPKEIAHGYEITALSPDGKIVEGLAHKRFPYVFAVQFHPEVPALYEDRENLIFMPDDTPSTMHRLIGRKSVSFHRKYWKHISEIVKHQP